jgi:hypothetical protein
VGIVYIRPSFSLDYHLTHSQFVLAQKEKAQGGKIGITKGCPITVTLIRHLFLFRVDIPGDMSPMT